LHFQWLVDGRQVATARQVMQDFGPGAHVVVVNVTDNAGAASTLSQSLQVLTRNGDTQPVSLTWPFLETTRVRLGS
jgi:hypothetical protein